MRWTRAVDGAGSIARVLRAEGLAAVRDRVWDRARAAIERAGCVRDERGPWPAAPILNVIGVPMTTIFGGVPLQLRARLRRESMLRPVALLSRWRLELWTDGRPCRAMTFAAGDWDGDPLRDDPAWLHAVQACAGLVNARAIHVENAAGLSLVSLAALAGIGTSAAAPRARLVPLVLSVHDFSLFCSDPHLPGTHDDFHSPQPSRPATPLAHGDDHRLDRARRHRALGADILRAAALTIYPSRFVRDRVGALLEPADSHVIAPGIEPPAHAPRSSRQHDSVALLGGGQDHKGGRRLARLAAALVARGMHVTSYGGYGHDNLLALRRVPGVRVRGYYRAGSLPGLLARQRASVALILSTVPESFSLVLSEAWAAGVPVVAPASGALIERLRAEGMHDHGGLQGRAAADPDRAVQEHAGAGGLLLSEDPSDEEILEAVERARRMPWDTLPAPPTAAQAADRHLELYRAAGFMDGR